MEVSQEYPFLIMSVVEGDGLINGQLIKKGDDKCQFFNIFFWIFIHSAVIVKSCKT